MGERRIEHTTASSFVARLEKRGLTDELAGRVAVDGSDELADAMLAALFAKLGITKEQKIDPNSLASKRRSWWKRHLKRLGIKNVLVPVPNVSDDEINRRATLPIPQKLFFNHFKTQADYDAFMASVGQGTHWTVNDPAERVKIGWEFSKDGYWFWAEVSDYCPRRETSWNKLTDGPKKIHLLSLEEYIIVWHATKIETQMMLDQQPTWCWLRTQYDGRGALNARANGGQVKISTISVWHLSVPDTFGGGRASEVVQN